jgi:hypothetical protein
MFEKIFNFFRKNDNKKINVEETQKEIVFREADDFVIITNKKENCKKESLISNIIEKIHNTNRSDKNIIQRIPNQRKSHMRFTLIRNSLNNIFI